MTGNLYTLIILFALGVIGLSSLEVPLIARVPDSTVAHYVSLANDPTPIMRQVMHDASAKVPMRHGLIDAKVER
jgi:hypothetical protein